MRWLVRALAAVALIAGLVVAAPARAQSAERIIEYQVDMRIETSGSVWVTEWIAYDFGSAERHGIYREVPVRFRYDDRFDRVYPVKVLDVQGSPGTPDQYETETDGALLRIRIGDPDRTVTGRHDYTILYQVRGALNGFADHDELYWNAVGTEWTVPIGRASATITAPAPIAQVTCFTGRSGSNRLCTSRRVEGRTAWFTQADLNAAEGLTVVVGWPSGAVATSRPVLDERWSFTRAFAATPWTLGVAGGLLLVALLVLGWLLGVTGRDRRGDGRPAAGSPIRWRGGEPTGVSGAATIEYAPPEGLRPAQAGLLIDAVVDHVDITATMVDLAVRGYLRIEELRRPKGSAEPDWRLVQLRPPDRELAGYERTLLDGLFLGRKPDQGRPGGTAGQPEGSASVQLSRLKRRFKARFERIRSEVYDDAMRRGWFAARPDWVRQTWILRGIGLAVLGAALTALAAWQTHLALVPVPVLLAGIALAVAARWLPRRTAKGSALARRVRAFRAYLATVRLAPGPLGDGGNLFSQYLPYAMVLGLAQPWTAAFAELAAPPEISWYRGRGPSSPYLFPVSVDHFCRSSADTLTATAAATGSSGFGGAGGSAGGFSSGGSSGGGSSGGGGGGGGGGSW